MTVGKAIEILIARKRATGCHYESEAGTLRAFFGSAGDVEVREVSPAVVKRFIEGGASANAQRKRHSVLSCFYDYLVAAGQMPSSPVPLDVPKVSSTFVPHIYTKEEIRKLLEATASSQQRAGCALSSETLRVLLLVLYATGLRVGEALRLEYRHVDLQARMILVEQAKFYKSRLVPIGNDVHRILTRHFGEQKAVTQSASQFVFQDKRGNPANVNTLEAAFARMRRLAGIGPDHPSTRPPRLHDLRHSFAVHRLIAWYEQGEDLHRLLPALSTYLGHVDLNATQRYLTMTPELLRRASDRFERYAQGGHHA